MNTPRAVYIGLKPGNRSYLLHRGYFVALQRFGWKTEWLSHQEGATAKLDHDVIIHDAEVPESVLARVRPSQVLIALNGAGTDISHYHRHAEKFALCVSSFNFFDDPSSILTRAHLRPSRVFSKELYYVMRYHGFFRRFAQPRFFRRARIPFMFLPFASDPSLFYPLKTAKKDCKWVFAGLLKVRRLVPALRRESARRGWKHEIIAPELKNAIDPMHLNAFYNRAEIGVNEQHLMTFGRELNQRGFDYGMAGIPQVTDMGWMCGPLYGAFCDIYAGKIANTEDFQYAYELMDCARQVNPDDCHSFFRQYHSFEARLAQISVAIGMDLTRGNINLAEHKQLVTGWRTYGRVTASSLNARQVPAIC
jgi:hypothetical protein